MRPCPWLLAAVVIAHPTILQGQAHTVREVDDCVNVRDDHDTDANIVGCLATGTAVDVIDSVPFWREVTFHPNGRGWMAKKFLEPTAGGAPDPTDTTIPATAFLEVHFIDVAQGDAIWITTHDDGIAGNGRFDGRNIVLDGGPYSANSKPDAINPVQQYMETHGHHNAILDALIVTHPHIDHFRGAENLSRHMLIRNYYDPGHPSTSSYDAFVDALLGTGGMAPLAEQVHLGRANFGDLDWGSEIGVSVLYADGDTTTIPLGGGNTRVNNASIVLRLVYGDHSFLLMGDGEGKDRHDAADTAQYIERFLIDQHATSLPSTVLKVGHHGSETSSTVPFIQAVDPDVVVVQSGRGSFSGTFLPDTTTLQRYCCHKAATRIYRTDQNDEADGLSGRDAADGDHIVIRTNGTTLTVTALEGGHAHTVDACLPACPH